MAARPKKRPRSEHPPKLVGVREHVKRCLREGRYVETWHADVRQLERDVTSLEVKHVLLHGRYVPRRDRYDPLYGEHGWSYVFEGLTLERRRLRIVVAFDAKTQALIVTVVDLDSD